MFKTFLYISLLGFSLLTTVTDCVTLPPAVVLERRCKDKGLTERDTNRILQFFGISPDSSVCKVMSEGQIEMLAAGFARKTGITKKKLIEGILGLKIKKT